MSTYEANGFSDLISRLNEQDYLPVLENVPKADEKDIRRFKKYLRQYFLHENGPVKDEVENVYPILTAPFLKGNITEGNVPFLYLIEKDAFVSLQTFLYQQLDKFFSESDESNSEKAIAEIIVEVKQTPRAKRSNYDDLVQIIMNVIRTNVNESEESKKHCDALGSDLLSIRVVLLHHSNTLAFELLNLSLKKHKINSEAFIQTLKTSISGLEELLSLHGKSTDPEDHHFDFANEMISFDKIADIEAPAISSELSEIRLRRIVSSLESLKAALASYIKQSNFVFSSDALSERYNLKTVMNEAQFESFIGQINTAVKDHLEAERKQYVKTMSSIKLAEIEIGQKYDEDIHDPYFEKFNFGYLSDEDLRFLRPVILIEFAEILMQAPQDMLSLISNHTQAKMLSINDLQDISRSVENQDQDMNLEIASLAVIRRNCFIFQGGADSPQLLYSSLDRSLNDSLPALWNLLIPGTAAAQTILQTAIESRFFPRFICDIRAGEAFGSHFDVSSNTQPENTFPIYELEIGSPDGQISREYTFTVADFLASAMEDKKTIVPIPEAFVDDSLIPLDEYLASEPHSVATSLPFIWTVTDENKMVRALVPLSWVQKCRSRIDYWQFFQELGGSNNYHVRQTLENEKQAWEETKKAEIEAIRSELLSNFEQTRTQDLERSIKRILNALLDPEGALNIDKIDTSSIEATVTPVKTKQPEVPIAEEPAEASNGEVTEVIAEAWIESDDCTSCDDCTRALPGVFKYNSDKQAYVHDPRGGSYAKIVAAAEKCPAACIHPGLPHDPDEPNLEKLLKRAEKYN